MRPLKFSFRRDAFENGTKYVLSLSYTWSSHKGERQNTLQVVFSNAPQGASGGYVPRPATPIGCIVTSTSCVVSSGWPTGRGRRGHGRRPPPRRLPRFRTHSLCRRETTHLRGRKCGYPEKQISTANNTAIALVFPPKGIRSRQSKVVRGTTYCAFLVLIPFRKQSIQIVPDVRMVLVLISGRSVSVSGVEHRALLVRPLKHKMGGSLRMNPRETRERNGTAIDQRLNHSKTTPVSYTHLTLPTKRIV